jgi:hypothetical protein
MTAWTHVSLDIGKSTLWKRTLIRSFERTKIFIKNYVVVLTEVERMHQKKGEGVSVGHCKVKKQNQVPYLFIRKEKKRKIKMSKLKKRSIR